MFLNHERLELSDLIPTGKNIEIFILVEIHYLQIQSKKVEDIGLARRNRREVY